MTQPACALDHDLWARAAVATAKARSYLLGRQSDNGGFCFYRSEHIDEPNLHDTYHAVMAALALLGADVPRVDALARFLDRFPLYGPGYYYYYAFALDLLRRATLIDAPRLEQIRNLPIVAPRSGAAAHCRACSAPCV